MLQSSIHPTHYKTNNPTVTQNPWKTSEPKQPDHSLISVHLSINCFNGCLSLQFIPLATRTIIQPSLKSRPQSPGSLIVLLQWTSSINLQSILLTRRTIIQSSPRTRGRPQSSRSLIVLLLLHTTLNKLFSRKSESIPLTPRAAVQPTRKAQARPQSPHS